MSDRLGRVVVDAQAQVLVHHHRFPFEYDPEGLHEDEGPSEEFVIELETANRDGRVIVALQGGTLTIKPEKGNPKKVVWETGKAYWLDADPPGQLHGDVNETTKPIEVMVVELQQKK